MVAGEVGERPHRVRRLGHPGPLGAEEGDGDAHPSRAASTNSMRRPGTSDRSCSKAIALAEHPLVVAAVEQVAAVGVDRGDVEAARRTPQAWRTPRIHTLTRPGSAPWTQCAAVSTRSGASGTAATMLTILA
jgi:hypothetical protein